MAINILQLEMLFLVDFVFGKKGQPIAKASLQTFQCHSGLYTSKREGQIPLTSSAYNDGTNKFKYIRETGCLFPLKIGEQGYKLS